MRPLCLAAVLLAIVTCPAVGCAEISLAPSMWSRAAANDNRRLSADGNIGVVSNITSVQLESLWAEETYSVSATPRVRVSRYLGDEVLNADDLFLNLTGQKTFELGSLQGTFIAEQEGTATTELTDSGRLDVNIDRTTLAFNGGASYSLGPRTLITATGGYTDVRFEELEDSRFFDFSVANAGLELRYAMSDVTALLFNSGISAFEVPANSTETTSYSFRAGIEHAFDAATRMTMLVGQNFSKLKFDQTQTVLISLNPLVIGTRTVPGNATASGQLVDVAVTRDFQQGELNVSWSRAFSPSSQGGRQKDQLVEGHGVWSLNERSHLSMRVNYRERESESDLAGNINALRIIGIDGQALYQLSKYLRAELGYAYRRQASPVTGVAVDSHELRIGFRFNPEAHFFNR